MAPAAANAPISYVAQLQESAAKSLHLRVCETRERTYQKEDWRAADSALREIAKVRVGLDADEAHWLRVAFRTKVWHRLGMGSVVEYLDRVLGYKPRDAYERLRVAEAIEPLMAMAEALRSGALCWSAVRELTRVVVPETEEAWIEAARGKTVREIEAMVSGRRPGDLPTDPASWEAKRHIISFEVTGATRALFREALAQVRRDAGSPLDDDAALAMLARQILGGPTDEGRAGHQIVIVKCPECGRMGQESSGTVVPLNSVEREVAECDAQMIEIDTHVGDTASEHTHVGHRAGEHTHVGEPAKTNGRATQTIPPATRRRVMRRQHGRCAVPGCTHSAYLHVHHVHLRSEGGTHDPDQLLAICSAHHTALHDGRLLICGRFSTGFTFSHADGTTYGEKVEVERASGFSDAFDALRKLGYREGESRRALDVLRPHVGIGESASALVLRALAILRR